MPFCAEVQFSAGMCNTSRAAHILVDGLKRSGPYCELLAFVRLKSAQGNDERENAMKRMIQLTVACVVVAATAGHVRAEMFTQTLTLLEQRNSSNDTLPFEFSFTGLEPIDPSTTTFTLDLVFEDLDLGEPERGETLSIIVDPYGVNAALGTFPITLTSIRNSYNADGTGQRIVDFSEIGGLSNLSDPFVVRLSPGGEVESRFGTEGFATLTLSYETVEAVPEPSTYAGLLGITCVSLLAYGWRRKRQQAA